MGIGDLSRVTIRTKVHSAWPSSVGSYYEYWGSGHGLATAEEETASSVQQ